MAKKSPNPLQKEDSSFFLDKSKKRDLLKNLLIQRRMKGLPIDADYAEELYEEYGFLSDNDKPYDARALKALFTRELNQQAEINRANFQSYQELQRLRLEHLLSISMGAIEEYHRQAISQAAEFETIEITHKDYLGYLKEARGTVAELSRLTGSNAPVEVMVSARLEKEVNLIVQSIQDCLPPETFQDVVGVLSHVMGVSSNRLGEEERQRRAEVMGLEAHVIEELDS